MDCTSMLRPLRWKIPVSWATHAGWSLAEPGAAETVIFVSAALGVGAAADSAADEGDGWAEATAPAAGLEAGFAAVAAPAVVAAAALGAVGAGEVHATANKMMLVMRASRQRRSPLYGRLELIRRVPPQVGCRSRH